VVINNIARRGRRLGFDIYRETKERIPLDLVGMGAEEAGGLGEVLHRDLPAFAARYRFFFNPIRYTSLGLAVIEAMMIGMPIVGLATTEMATVIRSGVDGFLDTDLDRLSAHMRDLLKDREAARQLGLQAQKSARERFGIRRFAADWSRVFAEAAGLVNTRRVA